MSILEKITIIALTVILCLMPGCGNDPDPPDNGNLKITGVSIPSTINATKGGTVTINGKGFTSTDAIILTLTSDASKVFNCSITSVTETTATFTLPLEITTGNYTITVKRGNETMLLGSFLLNITLGMDIPDMPGMTIKGIVYCDGEGIPGVVVSDGYLVTKTDNNGIYYLASQKASGFVFISMPGNYEAQTTDNIPQFFQRLAGGSSVEQKDFSLTLRNNNRHVVFMMADWHLARRNDDLSQFNNLYVPDLNTLISQYRAAGTQPYGIPLGDMTWELYWYDNNFGLSDYLLEMKKINCPMFNVMGNHDNDPYAQGDWQAEKKFKDIIGPTWYSFNLGEVHYVVLDNIQFINSGASQGVIGSRNYNTYITTSQLEWLQKDLAMITDKTTPVIIAMHAPLYGNPTLNAGGNQVNNMVLSNGNDLLSVVQAFEKVYVVTGHSHINYVVESGNVTEVNTGAVSATWWWTGRSGYAGNQICKDGSPGGYGVWEIDGKDVKWHYKSVGKPRNYQFRSYDINSVHITASRYAPNSTDEALAPYAGVWATPSSSNEVLLNVWGYDPSWTISVTENGTPLQVTRVTAKDPLHIISYEALRLNVGQVPTSSFVTGNTSHMFRVTASGATSTLEISVTDRFGNVYSETMTRPKDLTHAMQ